MIINSPGRFQVHYDYARSGLGQDPFANITTAFSDLVSSFGPTEWLVVGVGAFALLSMFLTTASGTRSVTGMVRKYRAKSRRKRELRQEYASL